MTISLKNRKLPSVAIISLAVGGACQDSGDGGGGSGYGSTPADIAQILCGGLQTCEPETFLYDYESMDDCLEQVTLSYEYQERFYVDYAGHVCADVCLEYSACINEAFARSCRHDNSVCYDEMMATIYACEYTGYP